VFLSVPVIVTLVIVARHSRDNDTKSTQTSAPDGVERGITPVDHGHNLAGDIRLHWVGFPFL
jgi:hypothetical protein